LQFKPDVMLDTHALTAACMRAKSHWPHLEVKGLEQLARFHRDAMLQSGAHALPHLAEEFALFQEVLTVCVG
jgi:hypothetical protein